MPSWKTFIERQDAQGIYIQGINIQDMNLQGIAGRGIAGLAASFKNPNLKPCGGMIAGR